MKNTYKEGTATIFTYKKDDKFISVCLELDLIDEGDNLDDVQSVMKERVESYVRYICDTNSGEDFLNRPAPDEYWRLFQGYVNYLQDRNRKSSVRLSNDHQDVVAVESYPIHQLAHA